MKQLIFSVLAGIMCIFLSCTNSETKLSPQAQKNLDACKVVNKAIETGDVAPLDNVFAADAIDHAGMTGDINGRDSIKAELAKIHSWADMDMEVIKEIADDEYVFQWIRFKGTAKTTDMGLPVGSTFDLTAVEVAKFKDGMVVEHWEFMQPKDLMKMMQQQPSPGVNMDNKMESPQHLSGDSVKK